MYFIETDHIVRTMLGAVPAVPAYERLIIVIVPEDSLEYAGLYAGAASSASFSLQKYAAALAESECIFGTGARAGRVFAGTANCQQKTVLHAPS